LSDDITSIDSAGKLRNKTAAIEDILPVPCRSVRKSAITEMRR
jgi:hypothetical protein